MMKPRFDSIALAVAAVMMALTPVAASAAPQNKNLGASRGGAKSSVNRGGGGGGNYAKQNGGGIGANNGNKNNNRVANNNRPNTKPNKNGNNVVAGNTVVVGTQPNRGGYNNNYNNGYYSNGRYYNGNNGNWDNDDDDFLEFVGKTAAVTAGVSVVAAVIGSTTKEKPSDCQQTVSNGQVYMNCNGTWYQPIQSGGQTQYQVIAPPQ